MANSPLSSQRNSFFIQTIRILALLVSFLAGCQSDKVPPSPAALSLKTRIQTHLDPFLPELAASIHKKKYQRVNTILDTMYANLNESNGKEPFFLALLDSHGVTISSRTQTLRSGSQNYGNYHVVARVLHKRKPMSSSLYLQGGAKVYIICIPLIDSDKLAGAITLGIDSEFLRQSGISESQFMSLDFTSQTNGTP